MPFQFIQKLRLSIIPHIDQIQSLLLHCPSKISAKENREKAEGAIRIGVLCLWTAANPCKTYSVDKSKSLSAVAARQWHKNTQAHTASEHMEHTIACMISDILDNNSLYLTKPRHVIAFSPLHAIAIEINNHILINRSYKALYCNK